MARTKQTARISTGGKAPRGANGPPLKAKRAKVQKQPQKQETEARVKKHKQQKEEQEEKNRGVVLLKNPTVQKKHHQKSQDQEV